MKLTVVPNGVSMQPETDAERCQLDVLKRGLVLANLQYFDWGSPDVGYGTTLVVKELEPSPPPMRYQRIEVYGA